MRSAASEASVPARSRVVASTELISECGATKAKGCARNSLNAKSEAGGFRHPAHPWVAEMVSDTPIHSTVIKILADIRTPNYLFLIENCSIATYMRLQN